MAHGIDVILLLLILANLVLLGSARLAFCVQVVAVQGVALSLLPLLTGAFAGSFPALLLAGSALILKGVVFPWLLLRALRDVNVRHEVEPYVGFTASLVLGVIALAGFVRLGGLLTLPFPAPSPLLVPVSFFMSYTGLFLIVARKKALNQVLGYLVLENGIYAFGSVLVNEQPWLVELGVLLDVFVAVFIMGIIIFHISREFDHIDTDRLAILRDWKRGPRVED
jgi:hydrogenase-4 component E